MLNEYFLTVFELEDGSDEFFKDCSLMFFMTSSLKFLMSRISRAKTTIVLFQLRLIHLVFCIGC